MVRKTFQFTGISALLLSSSAKAQIIYTDVQPDVIVGSSSWGGQTSYLFDIDQNGLSDFNIGYFDIYVGCATGGPYGQTYYGFYRGISIGSPVSTDKVYTGVGPGAYATGNCSPLAFPFQAGAIPMINTPTNWILSPGYIYNKVDCSVYCIQGWQPGNKFIAVRTRIGNAFHMGWIRAERLGNAVVIKDYAFCTIPNLSIPMGATSLNTGLSEMVSFEKFRTGNLQLNITFNDFQNGSVIHLYTLTGAKIYSDEIVGKEFSYKFDSPGVYLVTLENKDGRFVKKLFIY